MDREQFHSTCSMSNWRRGTTIQLSSPRNRELCVICSLDCRSSSIKIEQHANKTLDWLPSRDTSLLIFGSTNRDKVLKLRVKPKRVMSRHLYRVISILPCLINCILSILIERPISQDYIYVLDAFFPLWLWSPLCRTTKSGEGGFTWVHLVSHMPWWQLVSAAVAG